jgi:hypothetical protein
VYVAVHIDNKHADQQTRNAGPNQSYVLDDQTEHQERQGTKNQKARAVQNATSLRSAVAVFAAVILFAANIRRISGECQWPHPCGARSPSRAPFHQSSLAAAVSTKCLDRLARGTHISL